MMTMYIRKKYIAADLEVHGTMYYKIVTIILVLFLQACLGSYIQLDQLSSSPESAISFIITIPY